MLSEKFWVKYYHVYVWLKTGFGLLIIFIELLQLVITSKHYALIFLHTSQITIGHTMSSQSLKTFTSRFLVAASNGGRSPSSGFPNWSLNRTLIESKQGVNIQSNIINIFHITHARHRLRGCYHNRRDRLHINQLVTYFCQLFALRATYRCLGEIAFVHMMYSPCCLKFIWRKCCGFLHAAATTTALDILTLKLQL
jgi:hypothetical protein